MPRVRSMKKVITIGSALIDVFVKSDDFQLTKSQAGVLLCNLYGDKVEVDEFALVGGGGAGNTAVGFARQGFSVSLIAEMGRDLLADLVLSEQQKAGVEVDLVNQEKREETGLSVVLVAPEGGRTILVHRGAASLLEKEDVDWKKVAKADWVHQTNSSGQWPLLNELFKQAKENKIGVSWNPGKQDIEAMKKGRLRVEDVKADILLLNKEEWAMCHQFADKLKDVIREIVITDGRRGGEVILDGQVGCNYAIKRVRPLDETGAGDAFGVGYVSAHLRGQSLQDKCELGSKNAASVVAQIGAKAGLLKK